MVGPATNPGCIDDGRRQQRSKVMKPGEPPVGNERRQALGRSSYPQCGPATRLAIAAPSFDGASGTFIRDHVRLLAPGRTALLCKRGKPPTDFVGEVLHDYKRFRPDNRLAQPLGVLRRAFGRLRGPGLQGPERACVERFLRANRMTTVLAEYGPTGVEMIGPCADAGVRLFVHFHGFDATQLAQEPRWRRRYAALFEAAAGIIAPSRFLGARLLTLGCSAEKLHISPNGIDAEAFVPSSRMRGRVLMVGRLVEKKAPHLALRAFAKVHAQLPCARLDVVGDGPLRDLCQHTIDTHGLGAVVTMHGSRPAETVRELFAQAALFVQHSVTAPDGDKESFGISLVEAMASEVPLVATRHNGFGETVEDGVTGVLVDEHDVDAMAHAMLGLLEDPEAAARMGRAGRQRVLARFTHAHARERLRSILGLMPPGRDPNSPLADGRAA